MLVTTTLANGVDGCAEARDCRAVDIGEPVRLTCSPRTLSDLWGDLGCGGARC